MYFIYDALNYRIQRQEAKVEELMTMLKDISGIKYQLMDFIGRIRSLEHHQESNRVVYDQILQRLRTTEDSVLELFHRTMNLKPKSKKK